MLNAISLLSVCWHCSQKVRLRTHRS